MGRRPNPLVVEFFERGAKLEDKTNRYEHRCKKCGELFPKGRSDSLTSHLLRKCPNVTQEDREWVFDQLQQTPDRINIRSNHPSSDLSQNVVNHVQSDPSSHNLQQQSALDTLAEVSRHHLDYSSQRGFTELFAQSRSEELNEAAIIAQLQQGAGLGNPVATAESDDIYLYTADPEPRQSQQTPDISLLTTTALAASPLVQTASAANQQLEKARTQGVGFPEHESLLDPRMSDMGAPDRSDGSENSSTEQAARAMAWDPTPFAQPTFGALTMNQDGSSTGLGVLPKNARPKTRSHFNDTRRKEVQEIRKQGACLRCRMLKKPCSGETPCSTCRSVESARLWKGKCLRTRVADEFGLWSTNLFYTRAKIEVPAAIHGLHQQSLPGRVEARLYAGSDLCLTFAVKAYKERVGGIHPNVRTYLSEDMGEIKSIWLLDEGDAISDKIESYVMMITETLIRNEQSGFMAKTLERGVALIKSEEMEQTAKAMDVSDQRSPRSCYSLQNQLLKNVIELWVHTRLMALPETYPLQLKYDTRQVPGHPLVETDWDNLNHSESSIITDSSSSYHLIRSQLMAVIESRCSKLSKIVMNELERRLLQRQQVSRFGTFLSAVILLNAVELMTGLYGPFDNSNDSTRSSHEPPPRSNGNNSTRGNTNKWPTMSTAAWGEVSYHTSEHHYLWPLDTSPSTLWPQGPHFADLLTMLLRMRALPPKTCQTSDGYLAALPDYSLPVHVNGRPVKEQLDDQTRTAAEWLDPLKLKVDDLVQKRDGPLPGREEGIEAWEMRFVSRVLLPERIR